MTVYEQELRKLFEHSDLVDRPQFSGRVCVGDLGKDLRVRAEFLSTHISSQYDAIRLTVLNRTEGVVDRTLLRFQDVWGKKQVPNNPNFRSGVIPHLWDDYGKVEWYAYHPIVPLGAKCSIACITYLFNHKSFVGGDSLSEVETGS